MDPEDGAKREIKKEVATLGAGCFWCVEAVLKQVDGVLDLESGYMGGRTQNPTYEEVCSGETGHAEVVRVTFDPDKLPFAELLHWFWQLHDPTTLNQQGNDIGTQYRSVIFYADDRQRKIAHQSKRDLAASGDYSSPIVTEISEAGSFYEAENYHQDYYFRNTTQPYCRLVISPKLGKLGLKK